MSFEQFIKIFPVFCNFINTIACASTIKSIYNWTCSQSKYNYIYSFIFMDMNFNNNTILIEIVSAEQQVNIVR